MIPYVFLIAASMAGAPLLARWPKYRRTYLLALGAACWLLASLRYITGFDYRSYETFFQMVSVEGLPGLAARNGQEFAYYLLNLAVAYLGGDYRAFLFMFHFLLIGLVFVWIERYSPSPWMSVYLFLTLQYFAMSMNLLRQAFAAAVILWTYSFLKSRRFFPYCGVVLLAACFHQSALIMFPFYFLLNLRISKLHYGLAALLMGVVYCAVDPLMRFTMSIFPRYQSYLGSRYWQSNTIIYILLPLGCFLFILPLLRQTARNPSISPVWVNSVYYSLLIQLLITRHFILERLSVYVAVFSLAALPEAALTPECKCSSRIRISILIAGGLAYFLFAASQNFHGVYPFHGIWARAISA